MDNKQTGTYVEQGEELAAKAREVASETSLILEQNQQLKEDIRKLNVQIESSKPATVASAEEDVKIAERAENTLRRDVNLVGVACQRLQREIVQLEKRTAATNLVLERYKLEEEALKKELEVAKESHETPAMVVGLEMLWGEIYSKLSQMGE